MEWLEVIEDFGQRSGCRFLTLSNILYYVHIGLLGIFTMRVYTHYHAIAHSRNRVGTSNALLSWFIPIAKGFMSFYFFFYGFRAYRVLCGTNDSLVKRIDQLKFLFRIWMIGNIILEIPRVISLIFGRTMGGDILSTIYNVLVSFQPYIEFCVSIIVAWCLISFKSLESDIRVYVSINSVSFFQKDLADFGKKSKESDFEKEV